MRREYSSPAIIKLFAMPSSMLVCHRSRTIAMSTILEEAQADLARAKREASELRRPYNATVERVKAGQARVDKLLITVRGGNGTRVTPAACTRAQPGKAWPLLARR
jgi:hypothetical protein